MSDVPLKTAVAMPISRRSHAARRRWPLFCCHTHHAVRNMASFVGSTMSLSLSLAKPIYRPQKSLSICGRKKIANIVASIANIQQERKTHFPIEYIANVFSFRSGARNVTRQTSLPYSTSRRTNEYMKGKKANFPLWLPSAFFAFNSWCISRIYIGCMRLNKMDTYWGTTRRHQ